MASNGAGIVTRVEWTSSCRDFRDTNHPQVIGSVNGTGTLHCRLSLDGLSIQLWKCTPAAVSKIGPVIHLRFPRGLRGFGPACQILIALCRYCRFPIRLRW